MFVTGKPSSLLCCSRKSFVRSVRILLFGQMKLGMPTPVPHPPSRGMYQHSCVVYPPPKIHMQPLKNSRKNYVIW